jgi:mRNA-degrading endonuclease RelE of RelBE toxin-antitoxin system
MFRVFTTEEFEKDYKRLDGSDKKRVNKIMRQLKGRGDEVGKPLSGVSSFREMKFGGKRLYFLVYKDFFVVLAIAIGDKNLQQSTINKILSNLAEYQQYVFEELRKRGLL